MIESEKGKLKNKEKESLYTKNNFFLFPWWFKLIGYILSNICVVISIVFIIFKGKF